MRVVFVPLVLRRVALGVTSTSASSGVSTAVSSAVVSAVLLFRRVRFTVGFGVSFSAAGLVSAFVVLRRGARFLGVSSTPVSLLAREADASSAFLAVAFAVLRRRVVVFFAFGASVTSCGASSAGVSLVDVSAMRAAFVREEVVFRVRLVLLRVVEEAEVVLALK